MKDEIVENILVYGMRFPVCKICEHYVYVENTWKRGYCTKHDKLCITARTDAGMCGVMGTSYKKE